MSKGMLIEAHRRLKALKLPYDHLIRKDDLDFDYEWVIYMSSRNNEGNGYEHNLDLRIILH